MGMKRYRIVLTLIGLSFCLVQGVWAENILAYKFTKGQTFRLKAHIEMNQSQTIMGQKQEVSRVQDKTYLFVVESIEKDKAKLKVTCEAANLKMTSALGTQTYDSAKPDKNVDDALKLDAFLVGKSYYVFLKPNGIVEGVQGGDEIRKKFEKEVQYNGMQAGMIKAQSTQALSNEGLADAVQAVFLRLPEKAVKANETWTDENRQSGVFSSISTYTCKLIEHAPERAKIELNADIKTDPNGAAMDAGTMKMKYDAVGTASGSAEFEPNRGMLNNKTVSQNMRGRIEIENMPIGEIPFTMIVKTTITALK